MAKALATATAICLPMKKIYFTTYQCSKIKGLEQDGIGRKWLAREKVKLNHLIFMPLVCFVKLCPNLLEFLCIL